MSSRTEVRSPVTVSIELPPERWEEVCALAERAGTLPADWMREAVIDCARAGVEALPERPGMAGSVDTGDGYGIGV